MRVFFMINFFWRLSSRHKWLGGHRAVRCILGVAARATHPRSTQGCRSHRWREARQSLNAHKFGRSWPRLQRT
jgi:hypothetical protein